MNTSAITESGRKLFDLLDCMIHKVGMEHITQVVTNSASAYVAACELLKKYPHNFLSPCAAHYINNILKDFCDLSIHRATIEKARKIMVFIYCHSLMMNLIRYFIRSKRVDENKGHELRYQLSDSEEYSRVQECFEDNGHIKGVEV